MTSVVMYVHHSSISATPPFFAAALPILATASSALCFNISSHSCIPLLENGWANNLRRAEWVFGSICAKMPAWAGVSPVMLGYQEDLLKPEPILWMALTDAGSLTATSFGPMRTMGPAVRCQWGCVYQDGD
jgi:hypothetical protein